MGGLVSGLFGSKGTPSQVIDTNPSQFTALADPVTKALQGLLGSGGGASFGGNLTAPFTTQESALLGQFLNQASQPAAGTQAAMQTLLQQLQGTMNPFATSSGLASGEKELLPLLTALGAQGLQGAPTAPTAPGAPGVPTAPAAPGVPAAPGGVVAPSTGSSTRAPTLAPATAAQQQAQQLLTQILRGDFLSPESNPFLQSTIQSAQRPLLEAFQDVTLPRLQGQFTQAGQFIQPQSSSPFDRAAAISQRGLANALGDVSTRLAGENFAAERARQAQLVGVPDQLASSDLQRQLAVAGAREAFTQGDFARRLASAQAQDQLLGTDFARQLAAAQTQDQFGGNEFQRQLAGAQTQEQFGGNEFQRQLASLFGQSDLQGAALGQGLQALGAAGLPRSVQQGGLDRAASAFETSQGRATSAAGAVAGLDQQQLGNMLQGLQAAALPRMIEDLGIERGMEEFQRRIQVLLQSLTVAGTLAQPRTQTVSGTEGQPGALGSVLSGVGAIAPFFSDRRLKSDIRRVGALPNGIGVYTYTLNGEETMGVMADEVARVRPEAVHRGPDGYLRVDYGRIL